MKPSGSDLILFALSAIAAGVIAGVVGLLLTGLLIAGPAGLALSVFLIGGAAFVAVQWMALPAMAAGAVLWSLGRARPRLRRRWIWAAAGAAVGLAALPFPWPEMVDAILSGSELGAPTPWAPVIFALAGAAGALAFRGTMQVFLAFAGDEPEG